MLGRRLTATLLALVTLAPTFGMLLPTASAATVVFNASFDGGQANGFSLTGEWEVFSSQCFSPSGDWYLFWHTSRGLCEQGDHGDSTATFSVQTQAGQPYVLQYDSRTKLFYPAITQVQISHDGSAFQTIVSQTCGASEYFAKCRVDLSPYAGGTLWVRFYASSRTTVDRGSGWGIDNVLVLFGNVPPVASISSSTSTFIDEYSIGSAPVTLQGSAGDADGNLVPQHEWYDGNSFLYGVGLWDFSFSRTLALGQHNIKLVVHDDLGASGSATFPVTIIPNDAPIANAGGDRSVEDADADGRENVTLDASASSDLGGPIAAYAWSMGGSPLGAGARLTLSLPIGTTRIDLIVTDQGGLTNGTSVNITVLPDAPPIAIAPNVTVIDSDADGVALVPLDGSASNDGPDPRARIVDHAWSLNGALLGHGRTLAVPLAVGSYQIGLLVTDNVGNTNATTLGAVVLPNQAPVAAATAAIAGRAVRLDASSSRDESRIVAYRWTFEDGSRAVGILARHREPTYGKHAAILTVTDDGGASTTTTINYVTALEPARSWPPAPPANAQVADNLPSLADEPTTHGSDDLYNSNADVKLAWLDSDFSRFYVGLQTGRHPISFQADDLAHTVEFTPAWHLRDATWGGRVPAAVGGRLRVTERLVNGQHAFSLDVLRADQAAGAVQISSLPGSTYDETRAIYWWVLPRALLQDPPALATVLSPKAEAFLQTGHVTLDDTLAGAPYNFQDGLDGANITHDWSAGDEGFSPTQIGYNSFTAQPDPVAHDLYVHANGGGWTQRALPQAWSAADGNFTIQDELTVLLIGQANTITPLYLGGTSNGVRTSVTFDVYTRSGWLAAAGRLVFVDACSGYHFAQLLNILPGDKVIARVAFDASAGKLVLTLTHPRASQTLTMDVAPGTCSDFSFDTYGAAGAGGSGPVPLEATLDNFFIQHADV